MENRMGIAQRPKDPFYGLEIGKRVQLHPATDRWMRGDRWGVVTKLGRKYVYMKMDTSGRNIKVTPGSILV